MSYIVNLSEQALADSDRLEQSEPKAYNKFLSFLTELAEHPRTGTGHPEPLKGQPEDRWSRRISKKHRMIYRIYEDQVVVLVISAYGHYNDK
ncbi:MAG: Txe/YoeB family addiction module toxin [Prevotella sp.]|nr:Txe/YoeB family addiction module toxin [Prevotella sp.]